MSEVEWAMKLFPQGTAVTAVVSVISMILLKYVPSLIKEFRETVQGIVDRHSEALKEERELFRGEMQEMRMSFASTIKELTDAFGGRIDTLTEAHHELCSEVHDLRTRLEK